MFARAFSISSKAPSDDSGRSQTARRPVQDSHLGELHAPRSPGSNGGSPRKPVANSNLSDGLSLRGPMAGSGDAPFVKNRSVTVSLASPALSSGEAPPTPSPVIHVQAATPNTSLYYVPNSRGKTGSAASTPTKRLPAADPGTALPPVTSLSRELSSSHFLANQMAALSFNREVDSKSPATMLPGLSDSTLVIDRTPSAASLLSVPPLSNQPSMASIDGHYGAGSVTRSPSTVGPPRRRPVTATDTSKRMPTTAYIVEEGPPKYPLARDLSQISIAPSMNRSYAPSIISSAAHSPRLPAGPSPRLPHVDSYASLASFISKESNATCGTVASMARALPHLPPLQVWSQRMPEQAKRVHEDEKERQNIISEFIHSLQKHLMEIRTQNEVSCRRGCAASAV